MTQIQPDELNKFMEDAPMSKKEARRWRLEFYLKNDLPYEEETDNVMNMALLGE
jgi:hypothetical protein